MVFLDVAYALRPNFNVAFYYIFNVFVVFTVHTLFRRSIACLCEDKLVVKLHLSGLNEHHTYLTIATKQSVLESILFIPFLCIFTYPSSVGIKNPYQEGNVNLIMCDRSNYVFALQLNYGI